MLCSEGVTLRRCYVQEELYSQNNVMFRMFFLMWLPGFYQFCPFSDACYVHEVLYLGDVMFRRNVKYQ